jgi:hypothetical protein
LAHWFKYGSARRRARLRLKLMSLNPVTWLACRERWQAASFWVIAAIVIAGVILLMVFNPSAARSRVWGIAGTVLTLVLYIGFASQSCRFFTDARRNTVLELLLSTPLSAQEIIHGQWKAVLRMFGPPLGLFLAAHFMGTFISQYAGAGANPFKSFALAMAGALVIAADLATLTWFGMWMGLVSKNANTAAWKTLFFVQVLPWIALTFATGIAVWLVFIPGFSRRPNVTAWLQFITSGIPIIGSLAIDWWLYLYARRKLFTELRQRASVVHGLGR